MSRFSVRRLMRHSKKMICFYLPVLIVFAAGCGGPDVIRDLSDRSFQLVNQDSSTVVFPDDYRGDLLVIGFIYTHCPDICPAITANLTNVQRKLDETDGVKFVGITFDPERDTPSTLKQYMNLYNVSPPQWSFLTGRPTVIDSLMSEMGILVRRTEPDTSKTDPNQYYITHTNRITLIDQAGRIRAEYPGSFASPEQITEDLHRLQ
ncbi:MAG: SCO family protein [Balneolaceae bacterium]|nr:SCO family protein [Balneolaceae bacterium]